MWVDIPCETNEDPSLRLSILRSVNLATQEPVCVTIINLDITTHTIQALQDSLPGGVQYLKFSRCKWPSKKALLTKLGAAVPLGYKGISIAGKVSKADLLSFCTGLSERRGVYREVWVCCDEYKGPDVRVGEYVVLSTRARRGEI